MNARRKSDTQYDEQEALLEMLKTLADESRLTLLRLLQEREHTVGELAQRIGLGESTVSHHLTKLRNAGFASLRMAGNQRFYRLNEGGLTRFKRLTETIELTPEKPAPVISDNRWIDALGWSAEDQQVLRDYTLNGKLVDVPGEPHQTAQLNVILRWLVTLFEADRMYSELEVNAILKDIYEEDYVGLRRDLIDMGYLRRERGGGQYWLAPADEEAR